MKTLTIIHPNNQKSTSLRRVKTLTKVHPNNQKSTSLRRVKTLTTSSQKEARPKSAFLLDRSSSLNPAWRHSWKDDASLSSTPSSPSWNTCTAFSIVCLRPSPLFFLPCFLLTARADHWSWLGWGQRLRRAETAIRWRHVIGSRLGLLSDSCISAVFELRATSSSWSVTDMSWLWTGITQENDKFVISALDTGPAATLPLCLSPSLSLSVSLCLCLCVCVSVCLSLSLSLSLVVKRMDSKR